MSGLSSYNTKKLVGTGFNFMAFLPTVHIQVVLKISPSLVKI